MKWNSTQLSPRPQCLYPIVLIFELESRSCCSGRWVPRWVSGDCQPGPTSPRVPAKAGGLRACGLSDPCANPEQPPPELWLWSEKQWASPQRLMSLYETDAAKKDTAAHVALWAGQAHGLYVGFVLTFSFCDYPFTFLSKDIARWNLGESHNREACRTQGPDFPLPPPPRGTSLTHIPTLEMWVCLHRYLFCKRITCSVLRSAFLPPSKAGKLMTSNEPWYLVLCESCKAGYRTAGKASAYVAI